ncbi:MAG TPA: hypothetical protein VFI91_13250 [Longimicrobiaceae bacterium]|nr:hypothetical protein [Longimicrobiaceae bacterium]
MRAFGWLEIWGKTPLDLGLAPDQLDPAYEEAMMVIKNALESARQFRNS